MKDLELVRYKKSNKNKVVALLFSIGLLIMVIGLSYAFFIYNKTGLYTHTINGGKMGVSYNEITGNNITIDNAYPRSDKEALTYGLEFEFTITGYNESDVNVYYAIEMDHGADIAGKDRFLDSDMKLSLYENDEVVFENEIFNNLDNQDIHYGHISYGTSQESPVINTYKLRIWINDNVMITNTPDTVDTTGKNVYSSEEFANHYANFKVNVKADLTYDDVGYLTYDANGGTNTPKKTSLTTGLVTTQKPVMEGKGFLGWSGTKDGEVEFRAGDIYTGDYDVLYAVYSDTRNVMGQIPDVLKFTTIESDSSDGPVTSYLDKDIKAIQIADATEYLSVSGITEIYFINDTQENIDARYNAATYKADLTYNNQGSVKAWLEEGVFGEITVIDADYNYATVETKTYKLYIAAEETIYLSDGVGLFSGFMNAKTIDFTYVDTSMVTDMTSMFGYYWDEETDVEIFECYSLTNLNLSSFNTSQVTNMSGMFDSAGITTLDVSNFDTSNVTNMSWMFSGARLTSLDVSSFDTSRVTNMQGMFSALDLINVDVSNFDTSQVTNMAGMFKFGNYFVELDVSNLDTSNVTDMSEMFYGCYTLTELNVSNFDTSNVTNMSYMFYACSGLTSLDVSNFDTSNVTDMSSMFGSTSFVSVGPDKEYDLNLENFDTSKVTDMSMMFRNCSSLISLDVSNFDISSLTTTDSMFFDCSNLVTIYNNDDWSSMVTDSNAMFVGCTKLVGAISYSSLKNNVRYANPDTGYFTRKNA